MILIGYGNPLRGDDAAGLEVARYLQTYGVPAVASEHDAAGLLELWRGADRLIVVDAVITGTEPGTIHRFAPEQVELSADLTLAAPVSSHGLGLREAIGLARALGVLPADTVIYGIEGARFEPNAEISPPVERAVRGLAIRLRFAYLTSMQPAASAP